MRLGMTLALIAAVSVPLGGTAHRKTEEGNRHYEDGAYEEALRSYTDAQVTVPDAPELFYDIGNVLYRQGDFAGAAEAYSRALSEAPDELIGETAFNLGNARYRLEEFEEAAEAYKRALRNNPSDREAKRNLELAMRALQQPPPQQSSDDSEEQPPEEGEEKEEQSESSPQESGDEQEEEQQQQSQPDEQEQEDQQSEGKEPVPGEMTQEQAERLLDGLEEEELDNLREQALQRARAASGTEEDW